MTAGAAPFPWDAVLFFALRVLRWPPEAVWRATPREIAAALGGSGLGAEPLRRRELGDLLRRFPDRPSPEKDRI